MSRFPDFPTTHDEIEKARVDVWEQMRTESDRGCILVSASILEDALGAVMYQLLLRCDRFSKDKKRNLLGWMGPLGTFSSRIAMAYAFGLIPSWMYECLEKIRDIRNDFAHGYTVADFGSAELTAAVSTMTSPEYDPDTQLKSIFGFLPDKSISDEKTAREYDTARLRFTIHVVQIAGRLYGTAEAIQQQTANQASEATAEPAPGAASSSPQG